MDDSITCSEKERRRQSARCLDCGVPFCQAGVEFDGKRLGCPLHNLIPEWNDMLKKGNFSHALSRLLKVNCFPEFTGRVCPAFCERACVRRETGKPVTVRDNELFIIEYGFENGLMKPQPPQVRSGKSAAVIGSGPAGLAAAYYMNRRGHAVTVFERAEEPGGQLLNGIPEAKLPKCVVRRRTSLLEREGVTYRTGVDVGVNMEAEQLAAEFDTVISCCGPEETKNAFVALAIADGKRKAAEADRDLMGYTNMKY